MNFERFVATRHLTRRQGLFAFITTLIGVAGVSVGVAALITTLSQAVCKRHTSPRATLLKIKI